MKKRFSRLFAAILAAALLFTSGGGAAPVSARGTAGIAGHAAPEAMPEPEEAPESEPAPQSEQMPTPGEAPEDGTMPNTGEAPGSGTVSEPDAAPNPGTAPESEPEGGDEEPKTESGSQEHTGGQETMKGSVEVRIVAGVPVQKAQEFQVSLAGAGSEKAVLAAADKNAEEAPEASVCFRDLEAGTYELRVSGNGYAPYTQSIQVDGLKSRIQLYTGQARIGTATAHPGLLAKGDLNGDGVLDQKDADALVDAIESGQYREDCDLYGDGAVDLLDLNYLTSVMEDRTKATAEQFVPLEEADLSVVSGKIRSGSLEELKRGEGGIVLGPANDGVLSETNPAEMFFSYEKYAVLPVMEEIILGAPGNQEQAVIGGTVVVETEQGTLAGDISFESLTPVAALQNAALGITRDGDGTIHISLGGQVAVKKITITIKKASNAKNLAEISHVEFVNQMASRIPEPEMNIPVGVKTEAGNKTFTVSWTRQVNVTAYEVAVTCGGKTENRRTSGTSLEVLQFDGRELKNNTVYEVKVRSLNGEWKSGYSGSCTAVPKADKVPPAPDYVHVTGGYRCITVRWGKTKDTDSFNLYYREVGTSDYRKLTGIAGLTCQVDGLKDDTEYEVYVTGTNELGEGPGSKVASDRTISGLVPVELPEYRLINTSRGTGKLSSHIKSASAGGAVMVDSPLDAGSKSALGVFDNQYSSYVSRDDWDFGGAYPGVGKGVSAELDAVYEIGMIALAQPMDSGNYTYVNVQYWDENGQRQTAQNVSISQRRSGSRTWYLVKLREPIRTSRIQLGVGQYSGKLKVTISEIRFYEYDSLENEILGLYADDLFITLKDGVDRETIDALEKRLNTPDPACGELHPEYDALKKELENARVLLNTEGLGGVTEVDPGITAAGDSRIRVGGLTARQPLGVSAAAGEKLIVYVGNPGRKTGANTSLQLVYTQQHAESNALSQSVALKIGRNEVTVPQLQSTKTEKGGALYIQYTGNDPNDRYAVRVSGGDPFPVLNLHRVSGEERAERIRSYVQELKAYTDGLSSLHESSHKGGGNSSVAYAYQAESCILNATDIVTDHMMLSVPASQVLAGLGTGDQEKALSDTLQAMDEMLILFYQHKGLTDSYAEGTSSDVTEYNHLPCRYLNIRYMTMFSGAFMYAAGDHVGIEWGSVPGLMRGVPVVSDERGKYQKGNYFGWGIAHEIGHEINDGAYAHAEVTNNYFSVLAQAKDDNSTVRFQYEKVFDKVTSGSVGYASNVFTQLGLYWQLHLAYDRDYNYKTYDTWQEITENLFFARVDSYARNPASAPGSTKPVLGKDRDQNLMCLASAAAERDLTEFFTRWGMVPDSRTKAYMEQFPKEERAICYVDDEARVYEMEHGTAGSFAGQKVITSVQAVPDRSGTVKLSITSSAGSASVQGYEITRVLTEWGEEHREIAGFTRTGTFEDHAGAYANHVVSYEVTAIDRCMNRSGVYRTGAVKIDGSGHLDKAGWTVSTNMTSEEDRTLPSGEERPCEAVTEPAVNRVIDNDNTSTCTGRASAEDPYIVLELNRMEEVCALNYTCGDGTAVTDYRIEVSTDGETYEEVKKGTFRMGDGSVRVYFDDGNSRICTYDAAYVKLTAVGQKGNEISVTELDLYGPSGDNVELLKDGIGVLSEAYAYDAADKTHTIPKGSIVFTGTYEGNPAYNVVVLYDEKGEIVGGTDGSGTLTAHQIILAPPLKDADALLGKVSEGIWIYWFEPGEGMAAEKLPEQVRAELYRVDDAQTNDGQRLVSDTVLVSVPERLPDLRLSGR